MALPMVLRLTLSSYVPGIRTPLPAQARAVHRLLIIVKRQPA
jgi:hypothetical protein